MTIHLVLKSPSFTLSFLLPSFVVILPILAFLSMHWLICKSSLSCCLVILCYPSAALTVILDRCPSPSFLWWPLSLWTWFRPILNRRVSSPRCGIVAHSASLFSSLYPVFSPLCLLRCRSCWAGEALHPEATTVLRSLWLPVRPAEWPEMERSEACSAERDGGVHHPQQECNHRAHLPRGGAHGQ